MLRLRASYGRALVRIARRTAYNGAQRDWSTLPSGSRWCEIRQGGEPESFGVQEGQVVRVDYVARLDDGTRVVGSTASFKIGSASSAVCAALEEVVPGMKLGDTRRLRAPPQSRRGARVALLAPANEMLEYDVTLTGVVAHMRIMTLDNKGDPSDDPLQALVDFARRLPRTLTRLASVVGLASARKDAGKGGGGGGDGAP